MTPSARMFTIHHDARGRLGVLAPKGAPYVYFTTLFPGICKAWHRHQKQTDRMSCVSGMVRIVALAPNQPPKESTFAIVQVISGERAPMLITIPPGWWHGIQNLEAKEAVIVNCPDQVYDAAHPDEERLPWDHPAFGWQWEKRNG